MVPFFRFLPEVRTLIYTTNYIDGLNRDIRMVIKTHTRLTTEDAAKKLIFLALRNYTATWKRPMISKANAMPQFAVMYGERFTGAVA